MHFLHIEEAAREIAAAMHLLNNMRRERCAMAQFRHANLTAEQSFSWLQEHLSHFDGEAINLLKALIKRVSERSGNSRAELIIPEPGKHQPGAKPRKKPAPRPRASKH